MTATLPPTATGPAPLPPAANEPASTQPASTQPGSTQPGSTQPGSNQPAAPSSVRLHGLDALRAFALLLGILLHALLSFTAIPWIVSDRSRSALASGAVYVIHMFRMPLFMLLAGFFAAMSRDRKGTRAFLKDRVTRVLAPMFVFWPFAVMSIGFVVMGYNQRRGIVFDASSMPSDPWLLASPGQLWFLWSLMQCYVIVLGMRAVVRRLDRAGRTRRLVERAGAALTGRVGVLWAALPFLAGLALQGWRPLAIEGPMTLRPELPQLLAYTGAFLVGWLLYRTPNSMATLARTWKTHTVLAVVATVAALGITGFELTLHALPVPVGVLMAVYSLGVWAWVYALTGLCVRFLHQARPVIRYLADASYWMYLLHLPLVVWLQGVTADLAWPWPAKLLVTTLVPVAILLATYHLLVRSTFIGGWLNGRRYGKQTSTK